MLYPTLRMACLAVAALVLAESARAEVTIRFDPAEITVDPGQSFSVRILADLPDPVLGWGLDLAFHPAILAPAGPPVLGPMWTSVHAPDGDNLAGMGFPSGISGAGILLGTLQFSALSAGRTDLILGVTPGDLTEGFPLDPTGFAAAAFAPAHVTVTPEPASVLLLIPLLMGISRRIRMSPGVGHRKGASKRGTQLVSGHP